MGMPPLLEQLDLLQVVVNADDLMADLGEASACDQTDVSRADNADLDHSLISRSCARAQIDAVRGQLHSMDRP